MAVDDNNMSLESRIIGFYQAVSADKALRDASTDAEKLMDEFSIESSMREDVFARVKAVTEAKEELDAESKRLLEKDYKTYVRNGLGITDSKKKDRFREIKKRLSQLQIEFSKNLNEENGGIWFTPAELDGLPEDFITNLEQGKGNNTGKVRVTYKYPDLFPVLKYGKVPKVRELLFVGNENRLPDNVPLFREAMILRDEAARLLGYKNHAQLRIEDKLMKTPEAVNDFLSDLRSRLTPGGVKEIEILLALKKKDLESRNKSSEYDGQYYLWDHRYYDTLMLERDYAFDQNKVSEYFPLNTTINAMLGIFQELMGLKFFEITGQDRDQLSTTGKGSDIVWHADVQVFAVWDDENEGANFVGYLYFDLHPREGKYGHAANFGLQPGFIDEKGNRRYPATALVCNFPKATSTKPSLLKPDEVVTLFHELGHGIHDLVAKTTYSRFHGTSTARDFVEAPSQMLENFCWVPDLVKRLSYHYAYLSAEYKAAYQKASGKTDLPAERLPDDTIQSMIRTKHVNGALYNLRQLHFGIFDMRVHGPSSHEDIEGLDIPATYNKLRWEISQIPGLEVKTSAADRWGWGLGHSSFGHLM